MRRCFVSILVAALVLTQISVQPALADENDDSQNALWVVAGATAVAAALFFFYKRKEPKKQTSKERAADLIYYASTSEERDELDGITDPAEVNAFLARFFEVRDPTPGEPGNEFQEIYIERFEHANASFGGAERGWRSDRGRIYILRGEPASIRRFPFANVDLGNTTHGAAGGMHWTAVEAWEYNQPGGGNSLPDIFSDPLFFSESFGGETFPFSGGRMLYIFADDGGVDGYEQVFSTEPGEVIDSRLYQIGR